MVERELNGPRFRAGLASAFGLISLLVATAGVYGVVFHSVARRQGDLGVRIALGGRQTDIVRLVVGENLILIVVGILLGVLGAHVLARLISRLLYGVEPVDPFVFGFVASSFLVAGLIACFVPARRAGKVDPMVVLRG